MIEMTVETLNLHDGGQISASSTNVGHAGSVNVKAHQIIRITGRGQEQASGILSLANRSSAGNAGKIDIIADAIYLRDGGEISTQALGRSDAGNIFIEAPTIILNHESAITTDAAQGAGGMIELKTESLRLSRSQITATVVEGDENGGNITINGIEDRDGMTTPLVEMVRLENDSQINAETATGDGANIRVKSRLVRVEHSNISTNTEDGMGGDITLQPGTLSLDHGEITTNTEDGIGGNIVIENAELVIMRQSGIKANAEGGRGGFIEIT